MEIGIDFFQIGLDLMQQQLFGSGEIGLRALNGLCRLFFLHLHLTDFGLKLDDLVLQNLDLFIFFFQFFGRSSDFYRFRLHLRGGLFAHRFLKLNGFQL
ncbi:MAG: hypothetical protein IPN26_02555 [Bacteroidetes bacterium]|nr:hypothetical protein [Bacteroidota bacterium]